MSWCINLAIGVGFIILCGGLVNCMSIYFGARYKKTKKALQAEDQIATRLDEIELDLPTYLLDNFVEGCKRLLCEKEYDAKAGAKDSGDDDLMELFGDFLDPDSSDSESDDGDDILEECAQAIYQAFRRDAKGFWLSAVEQEKERELEW